MFDIFLTLIILIIAIFILVVLLFLRKLFKGKKDLESAKANLTKLLKDSEWNRTRAEAERDRTATIINSFKDGLIILDEQDRIFSINPEAERALGLEINKLLGKSFQFLADFPKASQIVSILSSGIQIIYRKEVELTKDFIVELSVMTLGSRGSNIGHLIVLHDISKEKMAEKTKTEFVSLAAHQLRTPLSITKWALSMLLKGEFGKLKKQQDEIIKKTQQNNDRLISLVNGLLNVTRIEEGRYMYKFAMTDIKEVVKTAINDCQDEVKRKGIILEFKEPADLPQTLADAEKIKIVVQNLIDNAVQYSFEAGKIMITLRSDEKNIEVGVQDFGVGIPKDQQDKIFTKFFRADNAAAMNTIGSGLGLFLVKNIVEAHGGIIWFKSEENMGTSFYFSLPIKTT